MRLTDWHGSITHYSCSCLARNLPRYMPTTMDHAPPARQPLPQPHDRIPPVVPQGVRSVPSPGLWTLCDSHAQFCRRHAHRGKTSRAVSLTSLVLVLHKSRARKEAYATVQR
jgi:hypothetical protein